MELRHYEDLPTMTGPNPDQIRSRSPPTGVGRDVRVTLEPRSLESFVCDGDRGTSGNCVMSNFGTFKKRYYLFHGVLR